MLNFEIRVWLMQWDGGSTIYKMLVLVMDKGVSLGNVSCILGVKKEITTMNHILSTRTREQDHTLLENQQANKRCIYTTKLNHLVIVKKMHAVH